MNKIDFVITWVDNTDQEWINNKNKFFTTDEKLDNRNIRYRDMECLKYWFRGVEKYAPWVNKIYFVTCGHYPEWLNFNCEKLVHVKHEDFIPKEYLPTFNSSMIELYLHKIPGISEQFVCFNDDMFITDYVSEKDFFVDGLPCENFSLEPIFPVYDDGYHIKLCRMMLIINKNFNFKKSIKDNFTKYINFKQGKYLIHHLPLLAYNYFAGFHNYHLPISHLKRTYFEVWEKEKEILIQTSKLKFRNNYLSINHWIFQYWNFASGVFYLRKYNFGKCININDKNTINLIIKRKYKVLCINDIGDNFDFEEAKKNIQQAFETNLNFISIFEKKDNE